MEDKEEKKRFQVNFRLSEEDFAEVEIKAGRIGLSVSAYAKRQTINGKVETSGITPEEVKEILSALGHIGGNLNQIAKVANQKGDIDFSVLAAINKNLDDLWKYIRTGRKQRKPMEQKLNRA